ncbi:uncharacterized protein LOC143293096 [Babylonia areolata]|uniref:uncharacterized protein LOC143293096 n=1 Tax=Babylonia areolata TaxID=304850 RepID=UPI003FD4E180
MSAVKLQMQLTDVMWEQVLCKHLLPYLSLKELFQLRGVSLEFRELVDFYFSHTFTVCIDKTCSAYFSSVAFEVLTKRNFCLKELTLDTAGTWLSDEALTVVLQNNPNLHTVDLSRCCFLTDVGVGAVGEHCVKLRRFSLVQCPQVTGRGLQSFIDNSACVEYINLSGCSGLTEDDLVNLATHCKEIKYFMLDMMYHLRDRTVAMIARSCPGLLQLNVQMSWRLTDHCIHVLGEFCPHLESLQVMNCQQISESSLAKLRERNVCIDKPDQHHSLMPAVRVRYQI